MAATVSAWAKPGAWALESEEHEHELLRERKEDSAAPDDNLAAFSDFPSLAAAAAASNKTKKKKGQTLSLGEFSTYVSSSKPPQSAGLTVEDRMILPTGPRQRTAEELDRSRLGGGFRSYGSGDRNESSISRWGSSRVSDENRRQGFSRDASKELPPSRADEIDDWGAAKKSPSGGGGFERRERGGGFFSDSQSRADESENWVSNKSFTPSEGRRFDRRGSFESIGSGGADSDNWAKKKEEEGRRFTGNGGAFDGLRERRGVSELNNNGVDSESWGKRREEGSGRPRLNLQPRKLPIGEGEAPTVKQNKGSNPFGDARPREEVLKEKGKDWKDIDEKLESMKIRDGVDGQSFGKKGFGNGSGRVGSADDRYERSWKKNETFDALPPSTEDSENGCNEEPQRGDSNA